MPKFDKYISTTLPYANSVPHIGHALEFVQADAIAKYFRLQGESVFLNIGVDENGLKVYNKAKELGLDTQEYLDGLAKDWLSFRSRFEISSDNFYRTTDRKHHNNVAEFWDECRSRGDLYKKSYEGKYCVGCESFKTETDLVDGKCADHNVAPVAIVEENWFFRVSKYTEALKSWLESNTELLKPQNKLDELRNIIAKSDDISVSRLRKNVPHGVPVPNDPDQVIYVWFDALLNYIFAVEDFDAQYFIQLCGPDNLRFQGSLFQAILESAGRKHTARLLVHGTVLDGEGNKISKSVGNVVDPVAQLEKYGLDAVRYYALAGLTTYGNGCWSEKELCAAYNSDLADDFGNLLTRVLHLIDTKGVAISGDVHTPGFITAVLKFSDSIDSHWRNYEIHSALRETNQLVKLGNKYINDNRPWGKDAVNAPAVLNDLFFMLRVVADLYIPVLSEKTIEDIDKAMDARKKVIIFNKISHE